MLCGCGSLPKEPEAEVPALTGDATISDKIAARVAQVLQENRERPARVQFTGYEVSAEHTNRLQAMPDHLRIPRSQWETHPNFKGRFQMPNFHHDFRQEIQAVIAACWENCGNEGTTKQLAQDVAERRSKNPAEATPASDAATTVASASTPEQRINAALNVWAGFKQHLDKHVHIEERAIFPNIKAHYPTLDVSFLYNDHKSLLALESQVIRKLKDASSRASDKAAAGAALEAIVDFDEHFVNHLGEEEEFIVPLCLSTKHCVLHGPKPS